MLKCIKYSISNILRTHANVILEFYVQYSPIKQCPQIVLINTLYFFVLIEYKQQVDETLKKKRTFKKFTYRGVDLDQLLDMPK